MNNSLEKLKSVVDLDDEIMISRKEYDSVVKIMNGLLKKSNEPYTVGIAFTMSPSAAIVVASLLATGLAVAIVEEDIVS